MLEAAIAAAHAGGENRSVGEVAEVIVKPFQICRFNRMVQQRGVTSGAIETHGTGSGSVSVLAAGRCQCMMLSTWDAALLEWVAMRIADFRQCILSGCRFWPRWRFAAYSIGCPRNTQTPSPANLRLQVAAPAWAQPGSATHTQVAPPPDFHRPSRNFDTPIGVFDGQSDIGSAAGAGSASYDAATGQYTINSAGYNIWYTRDEFRYLWKRMSGDVSLAADIAYPDPKGYGDRKAVLMIRQSLDDDSKAAMVALHGAGMVHLAWRPERDVRVTDMEFRIGGRGRPGGQTRRTAW